MNLEKFTDRAKGFLQAAQTIAIRMNHQRISPEHIAKALLEDNEGMAAGLIAKSGGDAARAVAGIDALLAKVPAVSGSGAQATPGLDNDAVRLLDQAEQVAAKAGDGYVTVERLLLAMVLAPTTRSARRSPMRASRPTRSTRRSTTCAGGAPPTPPRPKTATKRSRNSRVTSPRSRAKASSTP